MDKVQIFDNQRVRSVWDEQNEEWLFSIVDIVAVLTQSASPQAYWRKLKERLKKEGNETVTNCHGLKMTAADGKKRVTDVGNVQQIFRLIQSIPSPKAEPFKQWLAQTGSERVDETIDPEIAISRAKAIYKAKGYPDDWINQRMMGIKIRNELTDEWKSRGVKDQQYAILTDIIHQGAFGLHVKEHKNLKGLKKENLRDNMTTMESALAMFAEAATKEISQAKAPDSFEENKDVATEGGDIAGRARREIEQRTGYKVVTNKNASDLLARPKEKKKLKK